MFTIIARHDKVNRVTARMNNTTYFTNTQLVKTQLLAKENKHPLHRKVFWMEALMRLLEAHE